MCDTKGAGYIENIKDLNIELVKVEGSKFLRGCTRDQKPGCREDELPVHSVTLSDYFIANYELTVSQFAKFINETNYKTDAEKNGFSWIVDNQTPSGWSKETGVTWKCDEAGKVIPLSDYNKAVVHVSGQDAMEFCSWLSKKTGKAYRLPTEAEWEFAARGGKKSMKYTYSGSNHLKQVGWYRSISEDSYSGGRVHAVGELKANEIGLYDMSGNVWEWCSDYYSEYTYKDQINPKVVYGKRFVIRGGAWNTDKIWSRNSARNNYQFNEGIGNLGFRVAVTIDTDTNAMK